MQDLIDENSIIIDSKHKEYMCIFSGSMLMQHSSQWKYNREINHDKVNEIANYIKDTDKSILDTIIHCFLYNEQLIIFDGQHRVKAMKILYDISGIDIKSCCYIYNGSYLTDETIDSAIIEKFKLVNSNTPIPEIYNEILDDLSNKYLQNKKNIIEQVFIKYKKKYSKFYSINSRCNRPNFNDTKFKDFANECIENFNKDNTTIEELENTLQILNIQKKNLYKNTFKNTYKKCESFDFYLFL